MTRSFLGVLRSRRVRIAVLVIVFLLILLLSLTPRPIQVLENATSIDKIEHGVAYLVLAFFMRGALVRRGYLTFVITLIACAAFGGMIEMIQPSVGRSKDMFDFVADVSGTIVGAVVGGLVFGALPLSSERKEQGHDGRGDRHHGQH